MLLLRDGPTPGQNWWSWLKCGKESALTSAGYYGPAIHHVMKSKSTRIISPRIKHLLSYICQTFPQTYERIIVLAADLLYPQFLISIMPVPTIVDPPMDLPGGKPSQKSMTKAERRELQEKQRAAKAAKQQQQQGKSPPSTQSPQATKKETQQSKQLQQAGGGAVKTKAPTTPRRKSFLAESPWKGASKDANVVATEDPAIIQSHGLRIFSHFGQTKPVAQVKGDIHPSIIRLGLLFSEFKISGANARCIATLTSFKQVSSNISLTVNPDFNSAIGDSGLHYTSK